MTIEEAERAVEEAFAAYDMHEWERERWLEKYPEFGQRMWDEKHARLKTALIEAVRQAEREKLVEAMVMAGRLVDEASLVLETALLPIRDPSRSSEEAGNG